MNITNSLITITDSFINISNSINDYCIVIELLTLITELEILNITAQSVASQRTPHLSIIHIKTFTFELRLL